MRLNSAAAQAAGVANGEWNVAIARAWRFLTGELPAGTVRP
jgi:hypothetical protein